MGPVDVFGRIEHADDLHALGCVYPAMYKGKDQLITSFLILLIQLELKGSPGVFGLAFILLEAVLGKKNSALRHELRVNYLGARVLFNMLLDGREFTGNDGTFGVDMGIIQEVRIAHKLLRAQVLLPRVSVKLQVFRGYWDLY